MVNDELIDNPLNMDDQISPKSATQLDENRNDKLHGDAQKSTRFTFEKSDLPVPKKSPAIRHRSHMDRSNIERSKSPSWLTRKSADWSPSNGHHHSNAKNMASGIRRKELMIVLMGSSRVGKSSIVNQFLHSIFIHDYAATVDELHWIEYDATSDCDQQRMDADHNGTLLLKIMDASGSHEFIGMRKLYEQQGDAFVLVVGIDDPNSLDEAKIIRQEIAERNTKNAPVICVLNKIDLSNHKSRLNSNHVQQYASANQCLFVEVTATEHESVVEIFRRLLQQNSILPSQSQLKYRRKSVPISTNQSDYSDDHASKKVLARHPKDGKKYLNSIDESSYVNDDEKRTNCVIC